MRKPRSPAQDPASPADEVAADLDLEREGRRVNAVMLKLLRELDARSGQTDAERARRMGATRQQVDYLHSRLKTITLPLLIQWCRSHQRAAWQVLQSVEELVQRRSGPRR